MKLSQRLPWAGWPSDAVASFLAGCWMLAGLVAAFLVISDAGAGILLLAISVAGYVFLHSRWLGLLLWLAAGLVGAAALASRGAPGAVAAVAVVPAGVAAWSGLRSMMQPIPGEPSLDEWRPPTPADVSMVRSPAIRVEPVPAPAGLQLRTVGTLRLTDGTADITSTLEERPLTTYLWLLLLTHGLATDGGAIRRTAFADQLSPRLPETTQRERLRKMLYELRQTLPAAMADVVRQDRDSVAFNVEAADFVDVVRLRALAARLRSGAHDPTEVAAATELLEGAGGRRIPGLLHFPWVRSDVGLN